MAYEHSSVAPEKSQGKIKKMLIIHGASNVTIATSVDPPLEGFQAQMLIDNRIYLMRIVVPVGAVGNEKKQDQELRRVWRVLYHHMKAMFEASDSGVIELKELILPFLVLKDGRTLGKKILEDLPKALEAPRLGLMG